MKLLTVIAKEAASPSPVPMKMAMNCFFVEKFAIDSSVALPSLSSYRPSFLTGLEARMFLAKRKMTGIVAAAMRAGAAQEATMRGSAIGADVWYDSFGGGLRLGEDASRVVGGFIGEIRLAAGSRDT